MMDFLTFKSFISMECLILFYYIGSVVLPVGLWFLMLRLVGKYRMIQATYEEGKTRLWNALNMKQRIGLIAFFLVPLFLAELFWRMLFEFLIAYMQMRDALLGLTGLG